MEGAFELLTAPKVRVMPGFWFAFRRDVGPYVPWQRIATLDDVADRLERADVERTGPAFGAFHDLPQSSRPSTTWTADLGYPLAHEIDLTASGLHVVWHPPLDVATVRYRGDLTSFPPAMDLLRRWMIHEGLAAQPPLFESFVISDALAGVEFRDISLLARRQR